MYAWKHKYTDYNGNEREETFYFNLSKAELIDLEWRTPGGIENYMKHIMSMLDGQALADTFKMLIHKSYGVKDPEGRRFIKNEQVLNNFVQTEAYSDLYVLLATDDKMAAEFVNGIFPKSAVDEAKRQREMAEKAGINLVDTTKPAEVLPMPQAQPAATANVLYASQPIVQQPVMYQNPDIPMVEGQEIKQPSPFTPVQ